LFGLPYPASSTEQHSRFHTVCAWLQDCRHQPAHRNVGLLFLNSEIGTPTKLIADRPDRQSRWAFARSLKIIIGREAKDRPRKRDQRSYLDRAGLPDPMIAIRKTVSSMASIMAALFAGALTRAPAPRWRSAPARRIRGGRLPQAPRRLRGSLGATDWQSTAGCGFCHSSCRSPIPDRD